MEETLPEKKVDGLRSLRTVYMLPPQEGQEGWVAGEGGSGLLRYSDGRWQEEAIAPAPVGNNIPVDMYDLQMRSPDSGWAVGDGIALRFKRGEGWTQDLRKVRYAHKLGLAFPKPGSQATWLHSTL